MFLYLLTIIFIIAQSNAQYDFSLITVATELNDDVIRYKMNAEKLKLPLQILGLNEPWTGGNMKGPGGGQKIRLLKLALQPLKEKTNLIVMFTDSYDVVILDNSETLISKFLQFNKNIVFAAEGFCWPDAKLADQYPPSSVYEGYRFLNSGAFIGFAPFLYELVNIDENEFQDTLDDQLYYTLKFLDNSFQSSIGGISLDSGSIIFQNLNGALDDIQIKYRDNGNFGIIHNTKFDSHPSVIHGNGPTKIELNGLTNYLGYATNSEGKCQHCDELKTLDFASLEIEKHPIVLISIFIAYPTPFLSEFFDQILSLNYPREKIEISIYCGIETHLEQAKNFRAHLRNLDAYRFIYFYGPKDFDSHLEARDASIVLCQVRNCDYWLFIDSIVHIEHNTTIQNLIEVNRSIVAPMITRPKQLWSTFWGAVSSNGYYARSDDYQEIAERTKIGLWNVPLIRNCFIVQSNILNKLKSAFTSNVLFRDIEIDFSHFLREQHIHMYVDNREYYGHLIDPTNYPTTHLHNDLWTIFTNPIDWSAKYISPEYFTHTLEKTMEELDQPCPDVFWVPLVSKRFCSDIIEEMEYFGQWSDGKNTDPRLEGGYENVPTRDIHMRQLDWEEHWIQFLRSYVHPVQIKIYAGYSDLPTARMNFVVRYKPTEQDSLRPHHDASSYTLNLALNLPGIDYEGGGAKFIRYNCSVIKSRLGWGLLHPGRVTHIHEGLKTTKGTRYIFVTFINP